MCTNSLIVVYDKGGTVEVYGEFFKLIGLFCLLHLHVSIIFLNLQPPNVNKEWARSPCNGNHFSSINVYAIARAGVIFGIYFTSCRYSGG